MKKLALLLLLTSSIGLSTITRNPSGCATHPCVYTLSCATNNCNSTEGAELQTAIDEAFKGDTIQLTAGQTWTGTSSTYEFKSGNRSGSGTLLLTSTEVGSLPPLGTRITPHYLGLMPTIKSQSTSNQALWFAGGTNPASDITVRGIQVILQTGRAGPIQVGYNGSSITSQAQLPTNIKLQQIILWYRDWVAGNNGGLMLVKANKFDLTDSYIQGAYDTVNNSEKNVAITVCLDCRIFNTTFMDIAGENIIFGGTGPPYRNPSPRNQVEVAYCTFLNHKHRIPTLAYAASQQYSKGVVVKQSGSYFRAQASCTSTGTMGSDNCNWTSIAGRRHAKNLFEIKNKGGGNIHHNLFDGFWLADGGGADQYEAITYKVSGCPVGAGSGCQCVGPWNGSVSTSGTTVTSSNGNPLPNIFHCEAQDSSGNLNCCKQITINGTTYQIADYNIYDPYSLKLASSAGTQTNVSYSMCGSSTCAHAYDLENHLEYNIIRNTAQPFQFVQSDGGNSDWLGRHRIANNLIYNTSCSEFAQAGYGCSSWSIGDSTLLFAQVPVNVRFVNNTVLDSSFPYSAAWVGNDACAGVPRGVGNCPSSQSPNAGDMIFRNNIIGKGSTAQFDSVTPGTGTNATVITSKMYTKGSITSRIWSGNVIAGADISAYPAGTYNLCPTSAACTVNFDYDSPTNGKLFENYAVKNYKIRSTHPLAKGGYGPEQVGARWDMLPVIVKQSDGGIGVDIVKAGNTATLKWSIMAPMKDIKCSLVVSNTATGWDMDNVMNIIPPLPTESGHNREITLTGLSNGKYYYELHCGSMEIGSFTMP